VNPAIDWLVAFLSNGLLALPLWGLVLVTLALTHVTIVAVTVYLHRYSSHRALELHPALKHFFRFWLWLTTGMVTKEWTAIHRKHHAVCETEEDPHSPRIQGLKRILWQGAEAYRDAVAQPEIMARYGSGCPEDWVERNVYARLVALQDALGLDDGRGRLECFDISHTMGEATVASCVVFDSNGPLKSDYRRFNIEGVAAGDDYGAMEQALRRRYTRLKQGEGKLPDVLVMDGGPGQVHRAEEVLDELQVDDVMILGIAKGPSRKPGLEKFILGGAEVRMPPQGDAFMLLQQIRDEAHRFAITGHRQRRQKSRRRSELDDIAGVGPKRRRELLSHFGAVAALKGASVEEIAKVPGISRKLARDIYGALHAD